MAKRLVFTVTSGRSGTRYLTHLLGGLPDIAARHEPAPGFAGLLPEARHVPELAVAFLRTRKLPAIQALPEQTYIETSHYAAKGFFEPLLSLGIVPDLILLRRAPRLVASSWFLIGGSVKKALSGGFYKHMLGPNEPNFLPAPGWAEWHDYQFCYWYALEARARQRHYAELVAGRGGRVFDVGLDELVAGKRYHELLTWAGAPPDAAAARASDPARRDRRMNDMRENKLNKGRTPELAALDLDALEAGVESNCRLEVHR